MFDTGSTGFMLIATSLVMLMTPGLAFFYGGLVGRKNVLGIMMLLTIECGGVISNGFNSFTLFDPCDHPTRYLQQTALSSSNTSDLYFERISQWIRIPVL